MKIEPKHVLARIIAVTDATFTPCRGDYRAVLIERQKLFETSGIPWSSMRLAGVSDAAGRRSANRLLADLALGDLVKADSPNGRTLTAKLTEKGDASARELVGGHQIETSLPLLSWIDDFRTSRAGFDAYGFAWMPEPELASLVAGKKVRYGDTGAAMEFVEVQFRMMPLLVAGLAISNSDNHRRVSYALTAAGERMIDDHAAGKVTFIKPTLEYDPEADDIADEAYHSELGMIRRSEPENPNEIGFPPLSCSPFGAPRVGPRRKEGILQ